MVSGVGGGGQQAGVKHLQLVVVETLRTGRAMNVIVGTDGEGEEAQVVGD